MFTDYEIDVKEKNNTSWNHSDREIKDIGRKVISLLWGYLIG